MILRNIDQVMLILKFHLKTLTLITGFIWGIGWNFCHIFSRTVIIAVVLLLAAVF